MGQKTNPTILRLGKTKTWKSKYFEKKSTETAIYTFRDLEIRKFIDKFFKESGLLVYNCKVNYIDENSLHIFVSYYLTVNSMLLVSDINKNQKVKFIKRKTPMKLKSGYAQIKKKLKNYIKYQRLNYNRLLNKSVQKQNYKRVKSVIQLEKRSQRVRRLNTLKYYKKYLTVKNHHKVEAVKVNSFLEKFFESLHLFLNKKTEIFLTLKQLNKDLKQTLNPGKTKLLKKNLVNLKKYKQNDFFKEGINVLFTASTQTESANLLAQFIAAQLQILKRHNFFLKFVKTTLTIFKNSTFSNLQGVKIKIKGRFNGAPRAKHKIITIGKGVPALTLKSNIDYAEKTAYTSNGTFGVKVWICNN